jgi:hypothetical protein
MFNGKVGINSVSTDLTNYDLEVRNNTAANPSNILLRATAQKTTTNDVLANLDFGDNYTNTAQAKIQVLRDAAASSSSDLPTALTFHTTADNSSTPQERMRINNQGYVGIGTTAPNQKLDVEGNVVIRGAGTLYNNAGAAELHVGFALASPHTAGEVSRLALQPYGHTGGPFKFVNRDAPGIAYLDLRYGTSNLVTVTNYGNVGIGTTNPAYALNVCGYNSTVQLRLERINSYQGVVDLGADSTGMKIYPGGYPAVGKIVAIDMNGNVGIGTTAPSQKLEVCGNAKVVGQIIANSSNLSAGVSCSSDIRYKKDITPLTNALNNVMQLRGVNYYWKTKEFPEKQFPDTRQIGFIAQELEKVYPEVVFTDKDGYKSVDYSRLTPILVEAIKEQQKIIQKQQEEINALNEKLNIVINTLSAEKKVGNK